jgi:hypothetical protein
MFGFTIALKYDQAKKIREALGGIPFLALQVYLAVG